MTVSEREVHTKEIKGILSEQEIKKLILEYVAKVSGVSNMEYKHSTRLIARETSNGREYEAVCEITIDLGSKP